MNVFNFFHGEKLLTKIVISSISVYFFASVISYFVDLMEYKTIFFADFLSKYVVLLFVHIRLFKKDEDIYLIIQDNSLIFDIAKWYYQNNSKELDKNLGSKLIMNLTKKVSYFNFYDINSTQLIF